MTKKCTKCNNLHPINFFNYKNKKDNIRQSQCKNCNKQYDKERFKTLDHLIKRIYIRQKRSSIYRKHVPPDYTLLELWKWMYINNIRLLYDRWVKSDYNKNMTPSCDRLDDYKPYTLDNIRLVTWEENFTKFQYDRVNNTNTKTNKPVLQYTKDNIFVKEHCSQTVAAKEVRIHPTSISKVCHNVEKTAGGFIWKFKIK